MSLTKSTFVRDYLENFTYKNSGQKTIINYLEVNGEKYPSFTNEYWTSKQRRGNSLHEIAYRACFKSELPNFFIKLLSVPEDIVYDPFSGRGTTVIEAALLKRNIIANDINPLSKILCYPRLFIPSTEELKERLEEIPVDKTAGAEIDLSMFYHRETEGEIVSLKNYLRKRRDENKEDVLDSWIRMVATNRLTGHSKGFFSVYTLPPNQAVSTKSQIKINEKRKQKPEYKDTKKLILKKTGNLIKDITGKDIKNLKNIAKKAGFYTEDAGKTHIIESSSVQLTVTSPPFLNIVQYDQDNWLRCWFNSIDALEVGRKITMTAKIEDWCRIMERVFLELYRITKPGGYVAFEVGELQKGRVKLEEYAVPAGLNAGFFCEGIMINQQEFTKTANIWGIENNKIGTNTNRIVILRKDVIS